MRLIVDLKKAWTEAARQASAEARKAKQWKKDNPKGQRMSDKDIMAAHRPPMAEIRDRLTRYKYLEALERPTGKGGQGWAKADKDSMQASVAQMLGEKHGMNGHTIYGWANKHGVDLQEHAAKLRDPNGPLMEHVLGDKPLK